MHLCKIKKGELSNSRHYTVSHHSLQITTEDCRYIEQVVEHIKGGGGKVVLIICKLFTQEARATSVLTLKYFNLQYI